MLVKLLLVLVTCFGLCGAEHSVLFGALQSQPERAERNHAAGLRLAIVEVAWNRFEPAEGEIDAAYCTELQAKLAVFRGAGMQIMLDFGFQYPPQWVFDLPHARYQNQFGQAYRADQTPGANGVNAVFNEQVRTQQAEHVAAVFAALGDDFHIVRLGWGYYGELQYPLHQFEGQVNCYWAFDDLAQGVAPGLPPTMRPCPVPGWKPGIASDGHFAAALFLDWYLGCLQDYHDWQIRTVRRHFAGDLAMLYPSWGLRPGQIEAAVMGDLSGATPPEQNGEVQRGYDFARFIRGVSDANIIVYTTWIDADPTFGDDDSPNPARWSPAHYLSHHAQTHPLGLRTMGENTGPGTTAALELTLRRMRAFGLVGLMWAFEGDLYHEVPELATIDQFAQAIRTFLGE